MAEHAEGEGPNIDAAVFLLDVTLPGPVDDFAGTKVTDLCSELAITRQTLYRHVAPDGTLRKVVEGGKIRYGKKK